MSPKKRPPERNSVCPAKRSEQHCEKLAKTRSGEKCGLVRGLLERLEGATLLVADSGFSSFMVLWLARQKGCDVLACHHSTRQGKRLRTLGKNDELHEWKRPQKARVAWKDLQPLTPPFWVVRVIRASVPRKGYRVLKLKLCTTLLDAEAYPAWELINLYLRRWNIEVDFRTLKCAYGLGRLSTKTPELVQKEIYATLMAYNAIRAAMAQSGAAVRTLSPTRAREIVKDTCAQMTRAPLLQLPKLYERMLRLIAQARIQTQARPPQPRMLLCVRSKYPPLTTSRREWLEKYYVA